MRIIALMTTASAIAFSNSVPVVTIETDNGPVRINESDYDPDTMTLAGADDAKGTDATPVPETTPSAAPATTTNDSAALKEAAIAAGAAIAPPIAHDPAPSQRLVSKIGSKHFVVNEKGEKLDEPGIDPKGYKTDAEAWSAIMAVASAS